MVVQMITSQLRDFARGHRVEGGSERVHLRGSKGVIRGPLLDVFVCQVIDPGVSKSMGKSYVHICTRLSLYVNLLK